jgi:translation elongation factor EF-1alpha
LEGHSKALCYMQGTKHYIVTYRKLDNLEVVGYSDADFIGCVDSLKSTSTYVFTIANRVVSCNNYKKTNMTSSMMQAKFLACYEAEGKAIWHQLRECHYKFHQSRICHDKYTYPVNATVLQN